MNTQFRKLVTIRLSVTWKFVFYSLLVTFISFEAKAQQRFNAGIKAGLSTSQVAGDNYSGFDKAGFAGGFFGAGFSARAIAHFAFFQRGDTNFSFGATVARLGFRCSMLGFRYSE